MNGSEEVAQEQPVQSDDVVKLYEHSVQALMGIKDNAWLGFPFRMDFSPAREGTARSIAFYAFGKGGYETRSGYVRRGIVEAVADSQEWRLQKGPESMRALAPHGYRTINVHTILSALLTDATSEERTSLAVRSIDRQSLDLPSPVRGVYFKSVINVFWDTDSPDAESLLQPYVDALSGAENADPADIAGYRLTLNHKVRHFVEDHDDTVFSSELLNTLVEHEIFEPEEFNSVEAMTHPVIAEALSKVAIDRDVFEGLAPHARRNMANLLLESVLDSFILASDRHEGNTRLIKRRLFNEESYNRVLPMRDLLLLANHITQQLNETREKFRQQDLLSVEGEGTAMLVNCGEAIFRILAITVSSPRHVQENACYAELFDALMKPYYDVYKQTRTITIADICARYPDADHDIVLVLKDVATEKGYSAASEYYRNLRREQGKGIFWDRRKPGYGAIS